MIRYNKLFALLAERGMKKTDLLKIISSPTLAKLSKGEVVKTDIIERICIFLGCQPSDIIEIVREIEVEETISGKKIKMIKKDIISDNEPLYDGATVTETRINWNPEDPTSEEEIIDRTDGIY